MKFTEELKLLKDCGFHGGIDFSGVDDDLKSQVLGFDPSVAMEKK